MQEYICPPKIYKYTPLSGLKATLEHQTFKLSRPSDFNDPIDMYLQESIGQNIEEFLEDLKNEFSNSFINQDWLKKELIATPIEEMYDFDRLKKTNNEVVNAVNAAFNIDGVFCSTTDKNNLLMWAHYADHHRGAVIEYTPDEEKDSVFLASKPVKYSKVRPLPYKDAAAAISSWKNGIDETVKTVMDDLIYTKSIEWAYEREYRLFVAFMIRPDQKFATLKFHSKELTGIYFGCRMNEKEMKDMQEMATKINPDVKLYKSVIAPKAYNIIYEAYN